MPYIEEEFEYKGLKCIVLVNHMGVRCGYVGVEKSLLLNNIDYSLICDSVIVHGGITFNGYLDRVTWRSEDKKYWAFGFDCGHFYDYSAIDDAIKYGISVEPEIVKARKFLDDNLARSVNDDDFNGIPNHCTKEYVKEQTIQLAKQIKELEENGKINED